jgi:hypothetical protein
MALAASLNKSLVSVNHFAPDEVGGMAIVQLALMSF